MLATGIMFVEIIYPVRFTFFIAMLGDIDSPSMENDLTE